MEPNGVYCVKCAHFQPGKRWCVAYDCEIVTNLTLQVECPDYKRRLGIFSMMRRKGSEKNGRNKKRAASEGRESPMLRRQGVLAADDCRNRRNFERGSTG